MKRIILYIKLYNKYIKTNKQELKEFDSMNSCVYEFTKRFNVIIVGFL
jgi:hypothetical protein